MKALLIGGSKSGKSMLAQQLTSRLGGKRYYLATMVPTDSEDLTRIRRHRQERDGGGFETVEQPACLQDCFHRIDPEGTVLLDSVTSLLAQEMFGETIDRSAAGRTVEALLALGDHAKNVVYVSDMIYSDGFIYDETTEWYREDLAKVCRTLAAHCDCVAEVTAGIPRWVKGKGL